MRRIISHQDLSTSDLIVDAIYEGGVGLPGEPWSKVMPGVGNLGYRPGIDGLKPVTVGVEDVSRLISRIRHRQFGILVTTSLIARQAYQEVREDRHPILFFSGGNITNILVDNGFNTPAHVADFLSKEYPVRASDI